MCTNFRHKANALGGGVPKQAPSLGVGGVGCRAPYSCCPLCAYTFEPPNPNRNPLRPPAQAASLSSGYYMEIRTSLFPIDRGGGGQGGGGGITHRAGQKQETESPGFSIDTDHGYSKKDPPYPPLPPPPPPKTPMRTHPPSRVRSSAAAAFPAFPSLPPLSMFPLF